jgi:hypothetical protein
MRPSAVTKASIGWTRRWLIILAAALLLLSVGVLASQIISSRDSGLPLPPPGRVSAEFLNDGTPVFVVREADGRTRIVEAVSTHDPFGVRYVVVYCSSSGWFEELQHGESFTRDGKYLNGPAPSDLPTYTVDAVHGSTVTPGKRVTPDGRTRQDDDATGPMCATPDLGWDGEVLNDEIADRLVFHTRKPGADPTVRYLRTAADSR